MIRGVEIKMKRHAKLQQGVECYFTEGWSPQFQRNLTNFSVYIWKRYAGRDVEFEEFHSEYIIKVYERLKNNMYDPAGSNFKSYLYMLGRGVATTLCQYAASRRINANATYYAMDDCTDDEGSYAINARADGNLYSVENAYSMGKINEDSMAYFMSVVEKRGLQVNIKELRRDLYNYVSTPLTEAYSYIAVSGARYA